MTPSSRIGVATTNRVPGRLAAFVSMATFYATGGTGGLTASGTSMSQLLGDSSSNRFHEALAASSQWHPALFPLWP